MSLAAQSIMLDLLSPLDYTTLAPTIQMNGITVGSTNSFSKLHDAATDSLQSQINQQ